MKFKIIAAIFAVSTLSGCVESLVTPVTDHGTLTTANGNIAYVNRTSQVSTASMVESEKYLREIQSHDSFNARIKAENERQANFDKQMSIRHEAESKCAIVANAHEEVLYNIFMKNPTNHNYTKFNNYHDSGKISMFEKCLKANKG